MTYERSMGWGWRSGGAAWTVAIGLPVSVRSRAAALPVVAALALAGSANGQCVPSILGSADTPGQAFGVAVSGAVAYVADEESGLQVINVSSCEPCPADLDDDGMVGVSDLIEILAAWGNKGGPEDLDGSGFVDIGDLLLVLSSWGPCAK